MALEMLGVAGSNDIRRKRLIELLLQTALELVRSQEQDAGGTNTRDNLLDHESGGNQEKRIDPDWLEILQQPQSTMHTLIPPQSSIANLCSGRSSYQESETEHFTWDAATQLTPQSQIEDLQISRLRQTSSPNPEYSSECNENHSLDNILNVDSFTWDLTPHFSTSPQSQTEGLGIPATLIPLQSSTPNLDNGSDSFSQSSTPAHSNNEESRNRCWKAGCDGREFSTVGNLVRHEREKHGSNRKVFCQRCGACFTRTSARNKHLESQSCTRIRRYSNGRERPGVLRARAKNSQESD